MPADSDTADRPLLFENFADKLGDTFTLCEDGLPAIVLTLQKAEALNPAWAIDGMRPPFSLTFFSKDPRVLPQRLYRLAHDRLGEVMIFLVPSAKNADAVSYHATFN
ncbi:MAG: hypothetical protein WB868_04175 [Xanthobacteraceae bacterium]